ncbi:MAG TPA: hydantoinase/oxoprolinase family protein, partial [Nitrososphaerales archaeon]|nr:hydantoinase/oxoprolinase family protein [Nitrososphaerales archaeon]
SDGGASTISFASRHPASVLESGPAAGVIASQRLARQLSLARVPTFDMGGTTAKAGTVIDGHPDIINEFEAAGKTHSGRSIRGSGYPVRGQFIDLAEVSAGGGTIARVDEAGELKVGPLSAGSTPGPACYGRGGTKPTVTDANVLLGRLNPLGLLGGSMPVHRDLAARSIRKISRRIDLGPLETAAGIVRLVNDSMARAISMVTLERGRDPRNFAMFAFGGAGAVHACDLAEEMGITDIVVPPHAGLFSAYGLLAGELTRTFTMPVMRADPRLEERFRRLEESAREELRSEGFRRFTYDRFFEGRYLGQSHELLLPFDSDSSKRAAFDSRHRALYGYTLADKLEVVNIKVRAAVKRKDEGALRSRETLPPTQPTMRMAWVGSELRQIKVFRRESLRPGDAGRGPCIIEEYDSTLVVNPSWRWSLEAAGTRLTR